MSEETKSTSAPTLGTENPHQKAIEMIKASGILNPSFTLDKIMELSANVAGTIVATPEHTDTFIHSHFILTHQD